MFYPEHAGSHSNHRLRVGVLLPVRNERPFVLTRNSGKS